MAAPGISRLPLTRTVKKVEKPRPLKSSQGKIGGDIIRLNTCEEVMKLADAVVAQLHSGGPNDRSEIMQNIRNLASHLKLYGQQLEGIYGDQLDRTFTALRNFANDDRFDILTRLCLLELIELRAMHWTTTEDAISYYQHKMGKAEAELSPTSAEGPGSLTPTSTALPFPLVPVVPFMSSPVGTTPPPVAPLLGPGEVIKPSGKYTQPTKVPGKSYLKDEVVIRNADSGKVMGIKGRRVHMIEELSETIISFQRVTPGTKERLVQITGPTEEKIDYARQLMGETICRNASPTRPDEVSGAGAMGSNSSLNSSASDENPRPQRLSDGGRVSGVRRANSLLIHSLSTSDASVGEYKYTVTVGNSALRITGPDLKLVRAAKLVLDEHFSKPNWQNWGPGDDFNTIEEDHLYFSESETNEAEVTNGVLPSPSKEPPATIKQETAAKAADTETVSSADKSNMIVAQRICYTRDFLLNCSKSPHAQQALPNWWNIVRQHPGMARKSLEPFDVEAFLKQNMDIVLSTEADLTDAE